MSDHHCRASYKCSYDTSNHFLSADETEVLSSVTAFFSINSSHSIFESAANSVSVSQSIAQSLTLSNTVSFFTVSLLTSVFLQIIADIYDHSLSHYIISDQTYENLLRFLISNSHTETHFQNLTVSKR
ncbi:hypothetical protein EMPG_13485 [Blastomyces silverae]|uniref:Uncharacterized protein n=1 Tax=Blastomyces silverae TaxID=2060906 RepID=A0A0H1BIN4_9EURO|nr:hypothetical protein EMPG_13485 [Blastomyces silverae]